MQGRKSKYKVEFEQKKIIIQENGTYKECNDVQLMADSSVDTWNSFVSRYEGIEFSKPKIKNKRIICSGKVTKKNCEIEMAGDVAFNFNEKKLKKYEQIYKKEEVTFDVLQNLNDSNSICNYIILPTTGGMNNTKQAIGNDRFDTFIWALALYYTGCKTLILDNGSTPGMSFDNRKALEIFLDKFSGVYDYCEIMLNLVDKKYIDKLIKSGPYAIDSVERINEYIDLAKKFWDLNCKASFRFCKQNAH